MRGEWPLTGRRSPLWWAGIAFVVGETASARANASADQRLGVRVRVDADHRFQFRSQVPLAAAFGTPKLRGTRVKCYSGYCQRVISAGAKARAGGEFRLRRLALLCAGRRLLRIQL